jgi:hypothetical protein
VRFDASARFPARRSVRATRFGILAAVMPPVFWIGLGIAGTVFLIGVLAGARSNTASIGTGAAMGAFLGAMIAFPLLAIGLSTS